MIGDVPLGSFWLGWRETPWTPSGYDGWTTGKKPPAIVPPPSAWFRPGDAHAGATGGGSAAAANG